MEPIADHGICLHVCFCVHQHGLKSKLNCFQSQIGNLPSAEAGMSTSSFRDCCSKLQDGGVGPCVTH